MILKLKLKQIPVIILEMRTSTQIYYLFKGIFWEPGLGQPFKLEISVTNQDCIQNDRQQIQIIHTFPAKFQTTESSFRSLKKVMCHCVLNCGFISFGFSMLFLYKWRFDDI